jgi:preprotein translocase subunit SecA
MVGYEPPEASQWRVEIDRRRKEIEKRGGTLSLEEMVRDIRDRFRRGEPDWSDPDAADEEDDWTGDAAGSDAWDALDVVEPPPGVTGTIRRDAPKVGRNDPCPCGSGKKYKKCCLEAAQS